MKRLPKLKKGEPVAIKWIDAASRSGWFGDEKLHEIEEDGACHSIGWFIKTSPKGIYLTPCRDRFGEMTEPYLGIQFIPSHFIESVQRLKVRR